MKTIVAMNGRLPQEEREAAKCGLVVLVGYRPDSYDAQAIRRIGTINEREWHSWFDKATVLEDPCMSYVFASREALRLVPAISMRPRFVLIGRETAQAFGLWHAECNLRWRWVEWAAQVEGVECDPRPQLFAVCAPTSKGNQHLFWSALARACRNGRARTN